MLMADRTVTVLTLVFDPDTGSDRTIETALTGVSLFAQAIAGTADGGLVASSLYRCRIPAALCGGYEAPGAYAGTGWTLRRGDKLRLDTGEEVTVLAVHDNRRGHNPHIYVEAS